MEEIIKTLKSMLCEYVPEDPRHQALTAAIDECERNVPEYAIADSIHQYDAKLIRIYYCPKCVRVIKKGDTKCEMCGKAIKWGDDDEFRRVFKSRPMRDL